MFISLPLFHSISLPLSLSLSPSLPPSLPHSVSESEFIQYTEIDNHDDYYSLDNLSNVCVWDQSGKLIMYTVAQERLKDLEEFLLTIATYYIENEAAGFEEPEKVTINSSSQI